MKLNDFASDGWELVPDAFPSAACDRMVEAAGTAERLTHPHRADAVWKNAMRELAPLARRFLGPAVSGLGSYYFSQSAGYATHRDNDYVQAFPGDFLTVWLALCDVGANGPLVIRGKPIPCVAGSAIIIDGDTPHRSCAGRGPRPVAVFTYLRTGAPFRPGREERAEVAL